MNFQETIAPISKMLKSHSLKITIVNLFLTFFSVSAFAQGNVEMADTFRADGKIYVVVAVVTIILGGIVFYLFRTEQRLDKIEKLSGK